MLYIIYIVEKDNGFIYDILCNALYNSDLFVMEGIIII